MQYMDLRDLAVIGRPSATMMSVSTPFCITGRTIFCSFYFGVVFILFSCPARGNRFAEIN